MAQFFSYDEQNGGAMTPNPEAAPDFAQECAEAIFNSLDLGYYFSASPKSVVIAALVEPIREIYAKRRPPAEALEQIALEAAEGASKEIVSVVKFALKSFPSTPDDFISIAASFTVIILSNIQRACQKAVAEVEKRADELMLENDSLRAELQKGVGLIMALLQTDDAPAAEKYGARLDARAWATANLSGSTERTCGEADKPKQERRSTSGIGAPRPDSPVGGYVTATDSPSDLQKPHLSEPEGSPAQNPVPPVGQCQACAQMRAALQLLHDNLAEYQRINHLGGYDNQDMQMARAALALPCTCSGPSGWDILKKIYGYDNAEDVCRELRERDAQIAELRHEIDSGPPSGWIALDSLPDTSRAVFLVRNDKREAWVGWCSGGTWYAYDPFGPARIIKDVLFWADGPPLPKFEERKGC